MIIPFTDRIEVRPVAIFTTFVFIGQRLTHTDLTFSLLTCAFIVISAVAYNVAGGLSYPAGAFIFFNALLTAIAGLTYKIFLGEPGESHLLVPNESMLGYCACMAGMGYAAAFSNRLRPKRPLLPNVDVETMRYAALGCLIVGAYVQVKTIGGIFEQGSVASALHQLNYLPRMALIFATIYQLAKSGGKSATNWIVWAAGIFLFLYGVMDYSKEGLFMSIVTWLLTCVLYRYNFRWKHLVLCAAFAFVAEFILVPFAQYGRRSRSEVTSQRVGLALAWDYLKNPLQTRSLYLDEVEEQDINNAPHLYDSAQGFMDRMNMLSFDDALIAHTDNNQEIGLYPVWASYLNFIPHFIWRSKPTLNIGNDYAHEIGILGEDDTTTGISWSPVSDAYHEAKWFGILVVFPIIIFLYFFITESLTGGVRDTPYALLPIALAAHAAPEGMMLTPIYLQTSGAALLIVIAFLSKYVLAHFTRLAMGGERTRVQLTRDFILGDFLRSRKPVTRPSVSPPS